MWWIGIPIVYAEEQPTAPTASERELDEARDLLRQFNAAVRSDAVKAESIHEDFMTKSDTVKRGYGRHLESEWDRLKGEIFYMANKSRLGSAKGLSPEMKQKVKEKRELLAEIRALGDEGVMKKRLKQEGWSALEFLLTRYQRGHFDTSAEEGGEAAGESLASVKGMALLIGRFRYELFKSFGITKAKDPAAKLGISGDDVDREALDIEMISSRDRRVLKKNEALAKEIKSEEARGIRQMNEWRIALGLNALLIDPKLCDAGRDHSKDMAEKGFFAHESPVKGKKTPWMRAENFGTKARSENIAVNESAKASNRAWFFSPGHHKNMFAEGRSYVGLGGHGRHWTQMFR